jgi:RING finger protein 113A
MHSPPLQDYKETGYCTFGDSCKFAHMREDYKAGWQIERDWNEEMKQKRLKAEAAMKKMFAGDDAREEEEADAQPADDLPFACFICRERFEDPVETRCGHYFCEVCALKRMKKSSRCAVCNEPTQGIFNTAIKIRDAIRRSGGDPSKRSTVLPRAAVEEDEFAGVRGKSAAAERERESELGWRIGMSDAL